MARVDDLLAVMNTSDWWRSHNAVQLLDIASATLFDKRGALTQGASNGLIRNYTLTLIELETGVRPNQANWVWVDSEAAYEACRLRIFRQPDPFTMDWIADIFDESILIVLEDLARQ